MLESSILLNAIQKQLDDFCASRRSNFGRISEDLYPLVDFAEDLLQGGKRFRAQFCYWSWAGALANSDFKQTPQQLLESGEAMVGINVAARRVAGVVQPNVTNIAEETVWNYEGGLKLAAGRVSGSVGVYYQVYNDFQVSVAQLDANGNPVALAAEVKVIDCHVVPEGTAQWDVLTWDAVSSRWIPDVVRGHG